MVKVLVMVSCFLLITGCSHTYYIVRHAEKENQTAGMSGDVPLSQKGKERAMALKEILKYKKIAFIYSTNTQRTLSTAKPTADYFNLDIRLYGPVPDSNFINSLKKIKQNVLVVGHSNTVDDIVNSITNRVSLPGNLADSSYSNLFVIRIKGKRAFFTRINF